MSYKFKLIGSERFKLIKIVEGLELNLSHKYYFYYKMEDST